MAVGGAGGGCCCSCCSCSRGGVVVLRLSLGGIADKRDAYGLDRTLVRWGRVTGEDRSGGENMFIRRSRCLTD